MPTARSNLGRMSREGRGKGEDSQEYHDMLSPIGCTDLDCVLVISGNRIFNLIFFPVLNYLFYTHVFGSKISSLKYCLVHCCPETYWNK